MTQPTEAQADIVERTPEREFWRGIPVIAYHWEEPSGFPEPSSQSIDRVAYHWSTGPKHAERLIRLSDAAAEITRLRTQLAEAHQRGVKAGLDEAAKWLDNWGDATMGQEIGSYYAATAIRAIDPTTLTAGEGDHG